MECCIVVDAVYLPSRKESGTGIVCNGRHAAMVCSVRKLPGREMWKQGFIDWIVREIAISKYVLGCCAFQIRTVMLTCNL
jgi:hypothetical protein